MKVVWLIQNLVPYHHARFEAFAHAKEVDAHLIQVTDKDSFNVLEFEPEHRAYHLHTLYPGRPRAEIGNAEIAKRLEEVLAGQKPDCVCVSGWGMAIGQRMLAWALKHRVPTVMFSESTAYDQPRVFHKEWIKRVLVRSASAALVGGTAHRRYIHQLGMPLQVIFDGHNAVDSSHFAAVAETRPASLPVVLSKEPYFAVCTRFGEKKNLPRLVQAYSIYVDRCNEANRTPIRLMMGGDGETRGAVEAAIQHYGMQDRVLLLGSLDYETLPWFYQNCAAFIHASTIEQWGLVVNEAMAAGAPLLLSKRCGCAPDLLEEHENGFTFDPFDEDSMAHVMLEFTKLGKAERLMFGEQSRRRIQDWGVEHFASNLMNAVHCALEIGPAENSTLARLVLGAWGR